MKTTISAEVIGNNIDLLTEILLLLPVKPLIRFKCISKQWLSLISDPQFCLSHTRCHHHHHQSQYPTPTALLLNKKFYNSTPEFEIIPLKQHIIIPKVSFFHYLNTAFRIRQSCNGLLLCSLKNKLYYICNPITKQFKRLSLPPRKLKESLVSTLCICMAFDPLKSNHYKLIYVCGEIKTMDKYHIDMYSSETNSWSPSGITFTPPDLMKVSQPVFCNGAVHWYNEDETSLYFDVDRECLNTMPMPNLVQRVNVQYFGESRGHLHLIVTQWLFPSQFDVLEMAADYSGWFVRYHVNLNDVRIQFPKNGYRFSVLHVVRAQKEEESILVLFGNNKLISYNFHDGTSKKLYDLELPVENDYTWSETFQYFEILTPV